MNGFYTQNYTIGNTRVNASDVLRTSALLTMMQETASAHADVLGFGDPTINGRGLLWVIIRQFAQIERMPRCGEDIRLTTHTGKSLHLLCPRYYEMTDVRGDVLLRASAVWALMDRQTRKLVFPSAFDIEFPDETDGSELPFRSSILPLPTEMRSSFTVPFSYIDRNGHMNNARFFDAAEDIIFTAGEGGALRELRMEYHSEAKLGETICVDWGKQDDSYYLSGSSDRQIFKILLRYK